MATSRAVRVGVVGAGVAGLQAMRALRHTGAEVIAFEKAQGPGGLWRSNYAGFGIQVPKELYEFPGFPMTEAAVGIFADGPTVQRYIERYTRDALQSGNNPPATVEYETEIVKLAPRHDGKPGFDMHVRKGSDVRIETVDKAVVSTGMYSSFPTMPDLDGRSAFEEAGGQVVHSSEVTDAETMRSKDVIVVGAGKSAIDLALQAKKVTARAPTMLMRHGAHWAAPTHIAGLIPFQYVFLSRFGQALVALYKGVWPGGPKSLSIAHTLLAPVMRPVFAIVEALFKFQFGFKDDYVPPEDVDIVTDFYGYAHVLDSDFKKALGKDEVVAVQGEIARLHPGEAELRDGRRVPCDLVVCATGFGKDYSFLDEAVRSKLDIADDGHWLYRHTLPPKCPELAFCGAELATISNIGTYALQAEWIARLWSGKMRLPDQTEMLKDVEATKEWKRQWMPNAGSRANMILLHQTHFHDSLLTDMGLERKRKPNLLLECLEPYRPRDYDAVPCSS